MGFSSSSLPYARKAKKTQDCWAFKVQITCSLLVKWPLPIGIGCKRIFKFRDQHKISYGIFEWLANSKQERFLAQALDSCTLLSSLAYMEREK